MLEYIKKNRNIMRRKIEDVRDPNGTSRDKNDNI